MTRRTQTEIHDLQWRMERARAETVPCRGCKALAGATCINIHTGEPLKRLPAHHVRITDGLKKEQWP